MPWLYFFHHFQRFQRHISYTKLHIIQETISLIFGPWAHFSTKSTLGIFVPILHYQQYKYHTSTFIDTYHVYISGSIYSVTIQSWNIYSVLIADACLLNSWWWWLIISYDPRIYAINLMSCFIRLFKLIIRQISTKVMVNVNHSRTFDQIDWRLTNTSRNKLSKGPDIHQNVL